MNLGITLSNEEVAQLQQVTELQGDAEAVSKAAREYLRLIRFRQLKAVSGKVDYHDNWKELETLELENMDFPQ